jgi:hypothetical protein
MGPQGSFGRAVGVLARTLTTVALAVWPSLAAPAVAGASAVSCAGDGVTPQPLSIAVDGRTDGGYYVAPAGAARGLVVFSHGFTSSPIQWFGPMARVARHDGVIAVAMYNPGEVVVGPGGGTLGWRVREGAQAGIAAAQAFVAACGILRGEPIVDYGVSMGGDTSGLMAAAGARRAGGRPLFDYWFDIEGVTNVTETYLVATLLAGFGNSFGAEAKHEIEQEAGGTPLRNPAAYLDLSVVRHAGEIAASGIKGAVLVHGLDDGTVPYDQSLEMESALSAVGVQTDLYTVLTKTPGSESGSTLDGLLPIPHDSPFAGHGGDGSGTQLVIQTGLGALDALYQRRVTPYVHRVFLVDGTLGRTVPYPG